MTKDEFLSRYEALCRESGLMVHSCGCCSGPWVVETKEQIYSVQPTAEKVLEDHITHLREGYEP